MTDGIDDTTTEQALPLGAAVIAGTVGTVDPDGGPFPCVPDTVRALGSWLRPRLGAERVQLLVSDPDEAEGEHAATAAHLRSAVSNAVSLLEPGQALLVYLAGLTVCTSDDVFCLLDDGIAGLPEATGVSLRGLTHAAASRAGAATLIACDSEGLPLGARVRPAPTPVMGTEGSAFLLFSASPEAQGGPLRDGRALLAGVLQGKAGKTLGREDLTNATASVLRGHAADHGRTVSGPFSWEEGEVTSFAFPPDDGEGEAADAMAEATTVTAQPLTPEAMTEALAGVPRQRVTLLEQSSFWLAEGERSPSPSLMLAVGPEGIGKDTLIARQLALISAGDAPWVRLCPRDRRIPFRAPVRMLRACLAALGEDTTADSLVDAIDARLKDLPPAACRAFETDTGPWSRERLLEPLRMLEEIEQIGAGTPPTPAWSRDILRRTSRSLALLTLTLAWHGPRCLRISDVDLGGLATHAWLKALLEHCDVPGLRVLASARRNIFGSGAPPARILAVDVPPLDRSDAMELLVEGKGIAAARAHALCEAFAGRIDPVLMAAGMRDHGMRAIRGHMDTPKSDRELRRRMANLLTAALDRRDRELLRVAAQLDEPIDTTLIGHLLSRMDLQADLGHLAEEGWLKDFGEGPEFTRCWVRDALGRTLYGKERDELLRTAAKASRGRLVGRINVGRPRRRVWLELASTPAIGPSHVGFIEPAVLLGRALRALGLEQAALAMANELSWMSNLGAGMRGAKALDPTVHATALLWLAETERGKGAIRQVAPLADTALLVAPHDPAERMRLKVERAVIMARHFRKQGLLDRAREALGDAPADEPWRVVEALRSGILVDGERLDEMQWDASPNDALALHVERAIARVPKTAGTDDDEQPEWSEDRDDENEALLEDAWRASRGAASVNGAFRSLLAAARLSRARGSILDAPVLAARAVACARALRDLALEATAWGVLCPGLRDLQGAEAVMLTLQDARAMALQRREESEAIMLTLLLAEQAAMRGQIGAAQRLIAPIEGSPRLQAVAFLGKRFTELGAVLAAAASEVVVETETETETETERETETDEEEEPEPYEE